MSTPTRAIQPVARNLRRIRRQRDLSLAALAEASGLSKSTLSEIERGIGNPSLDTLWALATTLGIPFAELFDDRTEEGITVRRIEDAPVTTAEGVRALHLLTRPRRGDAELYLLELEPRAVRLSEGHHPGLLEHVIVLEGELEVGVAEATELLSVGDTISFPADVPHLYRAHDGPARALTLHDYP